MSEIKNTSYTVSGGHVSKEEYDKNQAEREQWVNKNFGPRGGTDFQVIKENTKSTEEATAQLEMANPVKPNGTGEDLKSPAARDSNASEVKVPPSYSETLNGRPVDPNLPEDKKLFNPSKLELLWKDRVNLSLGKGLNNETLTNALMGFNHRIATQPLPVHRQLEGYAFLTRPDINLSPENIANSRFFSDLAACPRNSIEHSVLASLDAECYLTNPNKGYGYPCYEGVPFDNLQAFLPIFSATVREVSGFPDQTLDNWMSEEGAFREQYGMVDSVYEVNNAYTLNVTLQNTVGEPMMLYIRGLMEWAAGVRRGLFKPKTYNQISRRIDYQSRIYIFKFDGLGKRIINWGAAMVSWPMNDNEGSLLNFNNLTPVQDNTKELSIQFQCIGARYRDTLLFESFNESVSYFNPDLVPASNGSPRFDYETYIPSGASGYAEIPQEEMHLFNWKGYPIIDRDTRTFRWYVPIDEYFRIRQRGGLS